jgi:solute carrier family 35 protein F1/2
MDQNIDHQHDVKVAAEDAACCEGMSDPSVPSSSFSILSIVSRRLQKNWKVIALGQCLSFLLASGGAAQATLHLSCGLSAPTFTMALVYLGLSIIHLPILFWKRRQGSLCYRQGAERLSTHDSDAITHQFGEERIPTSEENENDRNIPRNNDDGVDVTASDSDTKPFSWSFRWYLLLAFFDVEANAVTMLAFRYTTLTSVTLFDALAIPAAMIISRCIVFRSSRRYHFLHYVGVIVCMVGVVLNVFQDYESDTAAVDSVDEEEYPHKMWGDLCAITGGLLYGLNDVLTEMTVSTTGGTTEYLGMLGACAFLISSVQSLVLEREEIREFFTGGGGFVAGDGNIATCSLQSGFLLLFAFVGVTICSYVGASRFLIISEAAFFNLSLLTGDLWSVLFSVFAERIVPRPLFFAALAAVLSGVVVYEMAPSPALEKVQQQQEQNRDGSNDIKGHKPKELEYYGNGRDGIIVTSNQPDSHLRNHFHDDEADATGVELSGTAIT